MGLFIIAGLLIAFGILFWALYEKYIENWMQLAVLACLPIGCAMLLALLLLMGTNRANQKHCGYERRLYNLHTCARRM